MAKRSVHSPCENTQPTIIISPPDAPSSQKTLQKKGSIYNLLESKVAPFFTHSMKKKTQEQSPETTPSAKNQPTVGAAALTASFVAALVASEHQNNFTIDMDYLDTGESLSNSSSPLSSPTGSRRSSTSTESGILVEMKHALSIYQTNARSQPNFFRRNSNASETHSNNLIEMTHSQEEPRSLKKTRSLFLNEKYGSYQKGKVVGEGATAVIKLVELQRRPKWVALEDSEHSEHKTFTQKTVVAVKTFRKKDRIETERDYMKRLTSEFCISKALRHKHIIETYDLVQDHKGRWCAVMEYCSGGDVLTILQMYNLTKGEINCLFKQLLLGIEHIHACGVAHRDIKPENLIMTANGVLKITDFGVSDVVQPQFGTQERKSRGRCGSEPYWSPEMFTSTIPYYNGKALDIWSVAVTWYCLTYQQIPFVHATKSDRNYEKFLEEHPKCTWSPLQQCSQPELVCLYGMFDPNHATRWTIQKCLQSEWIANVQICEDNQCGIYTHLHTI